MNRNNYKWDVFICHATEDKKLIAKPLYDQLEKNGLKVWYDEISISTGNRMSKKIINGLKETRLGVIILSGACVNNNRTWPWIELGGFLVNNSDEESNLFPLRYGITPDESKNANALFSDMKIAEINLNNINDIAWEITKQVERIKIKENNIRARKKRRTFFISCLSVLACLLLYYVLTNFSIPGNTILSSNTESVKQQQAKALALPVSQENKKVKTINKQTAGGEYNSLPVSKTRKDYTSFLNTSVKNSGNKTDICVTIINESNSIASSVSSEIANIYSNNGYLGKTGLLKSSFISNPEFNKLQEGDYDIIENIKLSSYTDYLVLGKISFNEHKGELVNGTVISYASININIISASGLVKSFTVSANGNGVTSLQAHEDALNKLLYKYSQNYSSI